MSDEQQGIMGQAMNSSYGSSALELRLDTQPIIDKIELFLSGYRTFYKEDKKTGEIIATKVLVGIPKMNAEGCEFIVSFLNCVLSSAVVQGNWTDDFFRERLYAIREELAFSIMVNTENWGIIPEKRHMIMTTIMETLAGFLSRLLDNEERISYVPTIKTVETTNNREIGTPQSAGMMSGFGLFKRQ